MASTAIEFCAFTVAIGVVCHPSSDSDSRTQWSPTQLSLEILAGPYGDHINLSVRVDALHQGLFLFKKALRRLGHNMIRMPGNKEVMQILNFMDLPERCEGLNIIFVWTPPCLLTYEKTIETICSTANDLLLRSGFDRSKFATLGEVSGSFWLQTLKAKDEESTPLNKRRKGATEMGDKVLRLYGKKINDYVTQNICINSDESTDLYLAAAF